VPETGLLKYVLLKLPAQDPEAVKKLVRFYLFEDGARNLFDPSLLTDLASAAQSEGIKEFPSEPQAIDCFEKLVSWRAQISDKDPFGFTKQEDQRIAELIGEVLAQSIVPALPHAALTEENFQKIYSYYTEVNATEAIIALPYFAATHDSFDERVERIIKKGLQEQNANNVAHAAYALLKWRDLKESTAANKLISRLVNLIGTNRMIGLSALLWTANQMLKKGYLSNGDVDSLEEILPIIFDNADYRNISPSSLESVSVSLVRAACVRLARDVLLSKNRT